MLKLGQVGAWTRSRDLFLNFGTPLACISGMDKAIETSNLVRGLTARHANQKVGQKGRGLRYVTYF